MDIIGSIIGLVITLFVSIPVSVAIKLDSTGPIIFKQTRVTKNKKQFVFFKFRTMVVDASLKQWQLDNLNEATGPIFKIQDDPRITKVGKFLRKYSIDEMPQFWNVLKGNMSLVGPRPPLVHEVEKYTKEQGKRLAVKQGMTGLWQISGRSKLTFEKMVDLDSYYIEHQSVWLDLKILFHTINIAIRGIGSY